MFSSCSLHFAILPPPAHTTPPCCCKAQDGSRTRVHKLGEHRAATGLAAQGRTAGVAKEALQGGGVLTCHPLKRLEAGSRAFAGGGYATMLCYRHNLDSKEQVKCTLDKSNSSKFIFPCIQPFMWNGSKAFYTACPHQEPLLPCIYFPSPNLACILIILSPSKVI